MLEITLMAEAGIQLKNTYPVRIRRLRKKDWKMPPNTIYVGRPTKWGNPFKIGQLFENKYPLNNEQAVAFYKKRMLEYGVQLKWFDGIKRELKGKHLACWCPLTEPCHADILISIANDRSMHSIG